MSRSYNSCPPSAFLACSGTALLLLLQKRPLQTSVRIGGPQAEICTRDLPNTKQECYHSTTTTGDFFYSLFVVCMASNGWITGEWRSACVSKTANQVIICGKYNFQTWKGLNFKIVVRYVRGRVLSCYGNLVQLTSSAAVTSQTG
jgi:hypothetical protein